MYVDWNLYQIGGVPIHFHSAEPNREYEFVVNSKAQRYLYSPRTDFLDRQYLPEPVEIRLEGYLMGNCAYSALHILEMLRSIAGRPSDIFAYINLACCSGDNLCACQTCTQYGNNCQLAWYMTRGVLKSVQVREDDDFMMEVDIRLELDAYWRPVHRYLYVWGSKPDTLRSVPPKTPYENYINPYPTCDMLCGCDFCHSWVRIPYASGSFVYDPDLWVMESCYFPPEFPVPFQGITWSDVRDVGIVSPETLFGAPPHSIFAFRKLPQTGVITLANQHSDGQWSQRTDVTEIDLAATHQALASHGFTGLLNSDLIYIGDTPKLPGFIMRGGTILDNPRPVVTYRTWTPAGLFPGRNRIDMKAPEDVEFAFRIEQRRF